MPYDVRDPRSTLPTIASRVPAGTAFSPAEYVRFEEEPPAVIHESRRSWYARGQHFVLEYSDIGGETVLERTEQHDEYMLLLPDGSTTGRVRTDSETVDVPGRSLVVVPPGASSITVNGSGRVIRLLTSRATDLAMLASNADSYRDDHLNLAPLQAWPEPPDGFRVRVYDLSAPTLESPKFRLYRCTTLMVNFFDPSDGPRDTTRLSPHSHDDFEQCSLVLAGEWVHHIRWPWTTDLASWREDEHAVCGAPSVTVIPAQAIHTSQSISAGRNHLIDIFAPPREDFSARGWVLNADDYPMRPTSASTPMP
jgi:mannose-6-phosphate isomerase-like protein (cupin superfamily)